MVKMTHELFESLLLETAKENAEWAIFKNRGYTGGSDDPLSNLRGSNRLGIPLEEAIAVRLGDKFARLETLLKSRRDMECFPPPPGHTEAVLDTLKDIANYATILQIYVGARDAGK